MPKRGYLQGAKDQKRRLSPTSHARLELSPILLSMTLRCSHSLQAFCSNNAPVGYGTPEKLKNYTLFCSLKELLFKHGVFCSLSLTGDCRRFAVHLFSDIVQGGFNISICKWNPKHDLTIQMKLSYWAILPYSFVCDGHAKWFQFLSLQKNHCVTIQMKAIYRQ